MAGDADFTDDVHLFDYGYVDRLVRLIWSVSSSRPSGLPSASPT